MNNLRSMLVVAITFIIENLELLLSYIVHVEINKSYTVVGTQLTGSSIIYEQMFLLEDDALSFINDKQQKYKWNPINNPVVAYTIFSLIPSKIGHCTATKLKNHNH